MTSAQTDRSRTQPRHVTGPLWMLGALGLLLGLLPYPLVSLTGLPPAARWVVLLLPEVFWIYLLAGLIAWWRRPFNRVGGLLIWAGITMWLIALGNTTVPAFQAILPTVPLLTVAAPAHVLLAFPSGRLGSRISVLLVVGIYLSATVLQAPLYLFNPAVDPAFLSVADAPLAYAVGQWVQTIVLDLLLLAVAVVVVVRWRRARPEYRRTLGVVSAAGVLAVLFVPVSAWAAAIWWPDQRLTVAAAQVTSLALLPIVALAAFLLGGFRSTAQVEELAWFGSSQASSRPIRDILADALDDASLQIAYWSAELREWVSEDGLSVAEPGARPGRGRSDISLAGEPVAAIEYDAAVPRDPQEVERAVALVALALDHERLAAELRASRQAVVESRERLVGAADAERRRISRGLHDGLQARLLLIGIDAQRIAGAPPEEVAARATALRDDADQAAAELRAFVQDLVPPALIELGVAGAIEELVGSMPIPTCFEAAVPERVDHTAEMTVYLVVAEALANVVKHSGATRCWVDLRADRHTDGAWLRVRVTDNGVGGADPTAGSGLAGIIDRVAASGGASEISAGEQGGTTLWAQIPYES